MDEKIYLKGFNVGYELRKEDPEIFKALTLALVDQKDYLEGVVDGGLEYDKERIRNETRKRMCEEKHNNRANDNQMERDR